MIEYLLNAIRAVAGQEFTVAAKITDESGAHITEGCAFMLHLDNELIKVDGTYYEELECWQFTVAAELTKGHTGRFWYCFMENGKNLCFKEPIYLV